MRRTLILLAALSISSAAAGDEAADRQAVVQVVADFFEAMTARDVDRMRAMMTEDGMKHIPYANTVRMAIPDDEVEERREDIET